MDGKTFSAQAIEAAQASGGYLSANLRTPHCPEEMATSAVVGVNASDEIGTSEVLQNIEILNDQEAPRPVMEMPAEPLGALPGASISIKGSADDNFFIDQPCAWLKEQCSHHFSVHKIRLWCFF